ncbi:multidrug effflux MFS transporter [Rhizobium metallidurans]|uniref:Bcr/CflA family efflux transporter n=1 Tax=Rhizobium metallidurans TaxID=1265931 RepID=A0A7W6GCT5_9HYPH|nr:multidrug effflux MFS transporter [Rhizobium metallidurans]MBB3967148.1 DHA1 family purine ribonucleoside efflux pump-like MFS transporter/DHA1 family bicyclomycin/chloramphenicol resistance-like MFS transporter [Rhizobium metallidurans]
MLGALLVTIGPISMSIYTPAMPALVGAFGTTDAAIKLTLSLYFAGFSIAQLLAGPLSDAFGRRAATLVFVGIYMVGSLLSAFAPGIEWLLAGRLIQGIGASVGITVARAIVRDQFTGADASRIMNLIGIMIAIGPAIAPTVGGLALAAFGWRSVFFLLIGFGLLVCLSVLAFMRETGTPDRRRALPGPLLQAYGELVREPRFVSASLVLGGSIGALYAQATMLPFILIKLVGLSPTAFGLGMLMQSGSYFLGSVVLRMTAARLGGDGSVRVGLALLGLSGIMIALSVAFVAPSYLSIMGPVAFLAFGLAFLTPHMTTSGLFPFPHIAGSASAMMGFIQMGGGFTGGLMASLIGAPLLAFGTIIPAMALIAIISYLWFLRATRSAAVLPRSGLGE